VHSPNASAASSSARCFAFVSSKRLLSLHAAYCSLGCLRLLHHCSAAASTAHGSMAPPVHSPIADAAFLNNSLHALP
jgi:hypothetical protein